MVVVFGMIDIDLDTKYEYGDALLCILMATSPMLIVGNILLTAKERRLAYSERCKKTINKKERKRAGRVRNRGKNTKKRAW